MTFRLLGSLDVHLGDQALRIRAGKQRTILAMLLANAGQVVRIPSLVAEVWGDRPPRSAVPNLRTYVMQLRHALLAAEAPADERLVTSSSGYLLRVAEEEFDVWQFEAAVERGRKALAEGELGTAKTAFDRAVGLWRGQAAEDVVLGPALCQLVEHLTGQYTRTVEEHAEVELALGAHEAVVGRLRRFVERHRWQERAYRQLMLAMYRCGDVPGALNVFRQARAAMVDELGIDIGPELSQLHQAILRRDPELARADTAASVVVLDRAAVPDPSPPRQLPPAPAVFVGRAEQLDQMTGALRATTGRHLIAVHGPGGIGKSALVLRAAHAVADHYSDGQLYVDLQGTSPDRAPLSPAEVLCRFLRALGVPRGDLPAGPAEAATRFQSLLAGRRVLLVLDNAVDASQVAPLLPACHQVAALVTSRAVLATLEAMPVALDVLDETDAVELVGCLAGKNRVAAESDAARDIVRWCGRHPLALRIAGARLAGRFDWSLAHFAERLGDPRRRLAELRAADVDVRSCFAASYQTLRARAGQTDAARAFRLLGVLGVPEFDIPLVGALLDVGAVAAEAVLDELVAVRLLEPVAEGRFRMHDLLRLYAAELAAVEEPEEERLRTVGRALHWHHDSCRQMAYRTDRARRDGSL